MLDKRFLPETESKPVTCTVLGHHFWLHGLGNQSCSWSCTCKWQPWEEDTKGISANFLAGASWSILPRVVESGKSVYMEAGPEKPTGMESTDGQNDMLWYAPHNVTCNMLVVKRCLDTWKSDHIERRRWQYRTPQAPLTGVYCLPYTHTLTWEIGSLCWRREEPGDHSWWWKEGDNLLQMTGRDGTRMRVDGVLIRNIWKHLKLAN